jgi:uncharacterized heparinase superfamily protein
MGCIMRDIVSTFNGLLRYYNTIKYLRASQIVWRVVYKLLVVRAGVCAQSDVSVKPIKCQDFYDTRRRSIYGDKFFALNESADMSKSTCWSEAVASDLFLYNINYFDDVNSADFNGRSASYLNLMHRWVDENNDIFSKAYNPYVISVRIVNWYKFYLRGYVLPEKIVRSLYFQTELLMRRTERHILGNHYLENAKALVFSGALLECNMSHKWLSAGVAILEKQLSEQVLDDGGHFELSPMYQVVMLELVLDLIYLDRAVSGLFDGGLKKYLISVAQKMHRWLHAMNHPDGGISFFNDAAQGVYATTKQIDAYFFGLGLNALNDNQEFGGVLFLEESGYVRASLGSSTMIMDVGNIGPDYIPGHAHADTLSIELSIGMQRIFVNSGTSCYGVSPERLRQRSTASHNTLMLDNKNSSDVWGGFRVGKRAKPICRSVKERSDSISVKCAHDGYVTLLGGALHRREVSLSVGELHVRDEVEGNFRTANVFYHLHPDIGVMVRDNDVLLKWATGEAVLTVAGGKVSAIDKTFHPEFGVSIENKCLHIELNDREVNVLLCWVDLS